MLTPLLKRLPKYWQNVTTVLAGTVAAQIIPIAILPVLTRIVGQDDLGTYFLWLGMASVLTVVGTGRFDLAIFTATTARAVEDFVRLVIIFSLATTTLSIAAIVWLFPAIGIQVENVPLREFAVSMAIFAMAMAVHQSLLAIFVYKTEFVRMGWAKVLLASSVAIAQLLTVALGLGVAGLVYAQLLMTIIATLIIMQWAAMSPFRLSLDVDPRRLKNVLKAQYRFPVYSMPADFVNTFAAQLPLLIIAARFQSGTLAAFALTMRVLAAPIGLLANSILTVFKEQAGREYREHGNCRAAFAYTFKSLLPLAVPPLLIVGLFGEELFTFVFGSEWANAGKYAQILSPMFFIKFVASPLSYTLYISNRQLYDLIWQMVLLAMTWAAFTFTGDATTAVAVYSAGYSLMYCVYLLMSYVAAKGSAKRHPLSGVK